LSALALGKTDDFIEELEQLVDPDQKGYFSYEALQKAVLKVLARPGELEN